MAEKSDSFKEIEKLLTDKSNVDPQLFFAGCLAMIFVLPAFGFLELVINGLLLVKFWDWFIYPLGDSNGNNFIPHLNIPWALGISFFVSLIIRSELGKDQNKPLKKVVFEMFMRFLILFIAGWTCHHFMV